MPEVRLAWRAALCHGSPGSQVFVGVAPQGEQTTVCQSLPRAELRCYDLPLVHDGPGGPGPVRGLGVSPAAFGVLPLVRQPRAKADEPWDTVLTVALREQGALSRLGADMGHPAAQRELPFVALIGLEPAAERRFFDALAVERPAGGLAELKQCVAALCARLAAGA
jgi:hypothetical protein